MKTNMQTMMTSRMSIALTKETTEKIKKIAKDSGVRMYELVDALADLIIIDKDVRNKAVSLAKEINDTKLNAKLRQY